MKQKILFPLTLLILSAMTIAMETPNPDKRKSSVSSKDFIVYTDMLLKGTELGITQEIIYHTLRFAAKIENNEIFEKFLKRWEQLPKKSFFNSGREDSDLLEPLLIAAAVGNCSFLGTIINRTNGTIINNTSPSYPYTALGYAARGGHYNAVKLLLAYNADPHCFHPDNKKIPLALAIEAGKILCVKELLTNDTRKAEPNTPIHDKSFASLLHWALSLGNRNESVRELIAHGAWVNYISLDHQLQRKGTPLMVAIDVANKEGVEILLGTPKIDFRSSVNGRTPREFAEHKTEIEWDDRRKIVRREIVELLKKAEAHATETPGA